MSIFAAVLLTSSIAHAVSLDDLQKDAAMFQDELETISGDILEQEQDAALELQSDLFPVAEADIPQDVPEERGFKEDDSFVTVRIDGIPTILQDVPKLAWFAPYVRDIAEQGIVSGYRDADGRPLGAYGPDDPVSIEQIAKIAVVASGLTPPDCEGDLKNAVVKDTWSEWHVLCAEQHGWAVYADGGVDPMRPATRKEVIVTLLQAFDVEFEVLRGDIFTDVGPGTEFAAIVETAARDGIVSGYRDADGELTGEFGPDNPVTRAEVAKIVSLGIQVYGDIGE